MVCAVGPASKDPHVRFSHARADSACSPPEPAPGSPGQRSWAPGPTTYLVDEGVCPQRAQQKDGAAQCVPVAVQLLCLHRGEEAGEHVANVLVHLL